MIASGQAPVRVLGALAAEQHRIIVSDWRSFLTLAALDLRGRRWTGRLFHFSNTYLAALFLLLAIAPFTG